MRSYILMAVLVLSALNTAAVGATFTFNTDPFQGTPVLTAPGRQVVGGELFITFNSGTDVFDFNSAVFGIGNQIHFANGPINTIPSTGVNVVVLQTFDNDANAGTPFGAGNAADLIASRITDRGPGFFIYFNSSLDLPRLVYSTDLSDNTADLKILARMLNLMGQSGRDRLANFSADNFDVVTPEPSGFVMLSGAGVLWAFAAALRRRRAARTP